MPAWIWIAVSVAATVAVIALISQPWVTEKRELTAQPQTVAPAPVAPAPAATLSAQASPIPVPTLPPAPQDIPLGSDILSRNFSLVINAVEVSDQIETTSGGPIVAESGTQMVLVRTTYTALGDAVDLSCGSASIVFARAYDSQGFQMANVFEGNRLPGNPQCNYKTSAGQTVEWNIAYKIAAGREPARLSVIDAKGDSAGGWGPEVFASLK